VRVTRCRYDRQDLLTRRCRLGRVAPLAPPDINRRGSAGECRLARRFSAFCLRRWRLTRGPRARASFIGVDLGSKLGRASLVSPDAQDVTTDQCRCGTELLCLYAT
jgi:transposase InsO family protein